MFILSIPRKNLNGLVSHTAYSSQFDAHFSLAFACSSSIISMIISPYLHIMLMISFFSFIGSNRYFISLLF